MFLRPQHFQQQDRHFASALAERSAMAQPFHWGFSQVVLDEAALKSGRVTLAKCTGAFSDSAVFAFPGELGAAPSIEVPKDTTGETVYLIAPELARGSRIGARRSGDGTAPGTRYIIEDGPVQDAMTDGAQPIEIEVGTTNARLEIGSEERPGYVRLPVARIREVGTDRNVVLDNDFIPTVTRCDASATLTGLVEEIASLLSARAEGIAATLSSAGGTAAESVPADFLLLRVANAKGALFAEIRDAQVHHPEMIYRASVELAAELVTFTSQGSRRAPNFPRYDHDNIAACFAPVIETIRNALADIGERKAAEIPLKYSKAGVWFGPIPDAEVLAKGRLVIISKASMDEDDFRTRFPRQITIGSMDEIRDFIAAADRSVRIRALSMKPQELPPLAGYTYFEIDRNSAAWKGIEKGRSIAIHCAENLPDLKLHLWGIKE
jgi:type VI secretion system protein ImpJ